MNDDQQLGVTSPHKDFEGIKKIDKQGIEYWEARDLISLFGYLEWRKFDGVIGKAMEACRNSNQEMECHFVGVAKMIKIAKNTSKEATRKIKNYQLSRYACYLIAQNGDSRKVEIATAQTYFAIQTRRQEISEEKKVDKKRLYIRKEVREHNKKLFETVKIVGVSNFGKFNNYGYLGLYGLTADKIKEKKELGKDDILDRAGSTELAANLFRITQTDEKIKKDDVKNEAKSNATHYAVGNKVRKTIEEIGGIMPEDLSTEKYIKEIENEETKKIK